ncbi:MAG: FtsX-like permease family protein, partial [Thermodesulfobacteriota bacterium]
MREKAENPSRPQGPSCAVPAGPPGDIRRQVKLPLKKSVEIAAKSIRARFFRSAITTMTLVLAVAFLAYVDVTTDMLNGMLATHDPGIYELLANRGYEPPQGTETFSSSARQQWIIALSLLVCVVGIINAQLMAVTERFREIGTMKCLGALDRFVLRLFLLEAGFQGLIGAAVGAVAGFLFALVSGLAS